MNQLIEIMLRVGFESKEELEKEFSRKPEENLSESESKPTIPNAISQLKELRGNNKNIKVIKSHLGKAFLETSAEMIKVFAYEDFKSLEDIEKNIFLLQQHLSDKELRAMTESLFMESHRTIFDHGRALKQVGCAVNLPNISKIIQEAIDNFALVVENNIKNNQITTAVAMMTGLYIVIQPASKALEIFERIKTAITPYPTHAELIKSIAERRLLSEYSNKPEAIDYSDIFDDHLGVNLQPPANRDFLEIVDFRHAFDESINKILDEHVVEILTPIHNKLTLIESIAQKKYLGESLQ